MNYTIPRKIRELQLFNTIRRLLLYYTIPRKIRELQYAAFDEYTEKDYTIPRKIRELQSLDDFVIGLLYYTIPRKIRELQFGRAILQIVRIIPYQEKLGNYNSNYADNSARIIIPYQEKLGNYNYSVS